MNNEYSIWTDANLLIKDMQEFAQNNPNYTFVCADNTGGEFGWLAYIQCSNGYEHVQSWRISIQDFKNSRFFIKDKKIKQCFFTADGRHKMLQFITGKSQENKVKKFDICVIKNEKEEYYYGTNMKSELMFSEFPEHAILYTDNEDTKYIFYLLNKESEQKRSDTKLKLVRWKIEESE